MNKLLLGTTALVGAVFAAQVALADAPKVTVGGFSEFQLGVASDDLDAGQRHHAFRNDNEISFKIDGKSDYGLGYGAEIWLEADVTDDVENQGTNASKTFLYLDGNWGRFEMGSNLGAEDTLKIDASRIARATGGIDGDFYYFTNAGAQYLATPDLVLPYGAGFIGDESDENLSKVTYYSPRWYGFQAGVSYVPDQGSRGQLVSRAKVGGQAKNIFTAGLNYNNTWDQIALGAAATGEYGSAQTSGFEDLRAWQAGAKVGYLGFSVAGSYGNLNDSNQLSALNAKDTRFWTLGGAYEYGPFGVSVTYLNSKFGTSATTSNKFENWSVGADYKLAPGLTPYVEYTRYEQDPAGALADNDANIFLVGSQLNF